MRIKQPILLAFILTASITSCKKDDDLGNIDNIPGLGGDTWVKTAIDHWIADTLTTPYNIAVKYKWDLGELQDDFNKILVPPKEEKVIPLMSAIKQVWINSYIAEGGLTFFKNISPKFFILVGSPAYLNGAEKLGTAEGGRKVTLYDVNNFRVKGMPGFSLSDSNSIKDKVFVTIHHEFAHILDQLIKVPVEFSQLSASNYTSDWLNVTPQDARNDGFISPYGQSKKEEDWAEMVGRMLVEGKTWFDQYVDGINYTGTTPNGTTAEQARARLRQKEASVVSYFKQSWNIDFYSLQARSRTAISALIY
jgi:substrate import-associated zinc metallohydrolase lipoprotein